MPTPRNVFLNRRKIRYKLIDGHVDESRIFETNMKDAGQLISTYITLLEDMTTEIVAVFIETNGQWKRESDFNNNLILYLRVMNEKFTGRIASVGILKRIDIMIQHKGKTRGEMN